MFYISFLNSYQNKSNWDEVSIINYQLYWWIILNVQNLGTFFCNTSKYYLVWLGFLTNMLIQVKSARAATANPTVCVACFSSFKIAQLDKVCSSKDWVFLVSNAENVLATNLQFQITYHSHQISKSPDSTLFTWLHAASISKPMPVALVVP